MERREASPTLKDLINRSAQVQTSPAAHERPLHVRAHEQQRADRRFMKVYTRARGVGDDGRRHLHVHH